MAELVSLKVEQETYIEFWWVSIGKRPFGKQNIWEDSIIMSFNDVDFRRISTSFNWPGIVSQGVLWRAAEPNFRMARNVRTVAMFVILCI